MRRCSKGEVGSLAVVDRHAQDMNLIIGIKQSRSRAWDEYMERYGKVLTAWLYLRLGNWDDAADVHMEVLEAALGFGTAGEEWNPAKGLSFKNWLWRLAGQRVSKVIRKRKLAASAAGLSAAGSKPAAGSQSGLRLDVAKVGEVISRLTEAEQQLFRLRYEDLLTADQIGEEMDVSSGAVRQALKRLRDKVRRLLQDA